MIYATTRPGRPERDLTEDEKLKAEDLLRAMSDRVGWMLGSLEASEPLEEHLLEHETFAGDLQALIWGEDES